jgi:hypothetical protein
LNLLLDDGQWLTLARHGRQNWIESTADEIARRLGVPVRLDMETDDD